MGIAPPWGCAQNSAWHAAQIWAEVLGQYHACQAAEDDAGLETHEKKGQSPLLTSPQVLASFLSFLQEVFLDISGHSSALNSLFQCPFGTITDWGRVCLSHWSVRPFRFMSPAGVLGKFMYPLHLRIEAIKAQKGEVTGPRWSH